MSFGSPEWRDWALTEEQSRPILWRAFDAGINFFDTADVYSDGLSEDFLGRAIRDFGRRDDVVVATKVFHPTGGGPNDRGLSRQHIMSAIDRSLRRLSVEYVDLYIINRWDPETPIEETLDALNDLVRMGTAPLLGVTRAAQLEDSVRALEVTLSSEDVCYLEDAYQPHSVVGHT